MPTAIARVSCPVCHTEFQTYIEQVLDARVDPGAKNRVLSGAVNVAVCPRCGNGGSLNLPFIYHDPDHEVALLYLPMESGRSEIERQRFAGVLTQQLMNSLAPEERRGYLLQPETFVTMESLVRRALEIEGVTEEEMQRSQDQRELVSRLLEAEPDAWDALIAENESLIDEGFFGLIQYLLQVTGAEPEAASEAGAEDEEAPVSAEAEPFRRLYLHLIEKHPVGQRLVARTAVVRIFADNPSAETLLQALVEATDTETVNMLVQMGAKAMDYRFFQLLLQRVETAETPEEQTRLKALRRQVLDRREVLNKAGQDLAEERLDLLDKLMSSEDPLKMARSHLSEIDEAFMYLLQTQLQEAQKLDDKPLLEALNRVVAVLNRLSEEAMPPEMLFVRRLLAAPDEEQLVEFLRENQPLLQPQLFEFLEALEQETRERGDTGVADRLALARQKAQELAGPMEPAASSLKAPTASRPAADLDEGQRQTPSGLIISRR
ncbi:MAG: hypothetical protein JW892_17470 [Anaerolineae bacterium]|nr:hypothetical protein [Anaerolineae bacterium]